MCTRLREREESSCDWQKKPHETSPRFTCSDLVSIVGFFFLLKIFFRLQIKSCYIQNYSLHGTMCHEMLSHLTPITVQHHKNMTQKASQNKIFIKLKYIKIMYTVVARLCIDYAISAMTRVFKQM